MNYAFDWIFNNNKKYKKQVQFNKHIQVILIPSITDFCENKIVNDIWWNRYELYEIKRGAVMEIVKIMVLYDIPYKMAMKLLYNSEDTSI